MKTNIENKTPATGSKKDLEAQAKHFIAFLNSEAFCTNPTLEHLYMELTALYNVAVQHAKFYKKKRIFLMGNVLYKEMKEGNSGKLEQYKNKRIVSETAYDALKKLQFIYYTNFFLDEKQDDVVCRSLEDDMDHILMDIIGILVFRKVFPEYNRKATSVSDQLYVDFKIHWGSNHCMDLIRAMHFKLRRAY